MAWGGREGARECDERGGAARKWCILTRLRNSGDECSAIKGKMMNQKEEEMSGGEERRGEETNERKEIENYEPD